MYFLPISYIHTALKRQQIIARITRTIFLLFFLLLTIRTEAKSVIFHEAVIELYAETGTALNSGEDNFKLKQKKFIRELYYEQRYYDCIAETIRFCSADKSAAEKECLYFIEMNYFMGKQYKTVISDLLSLSELNENRNLLFLLSWSYSAINLNKDALNILNNINYDQMQDNEKAELFKNKAGILLKSYRYRDLLVEFAECKKYKPIEEFNELKKDIELYSVSGEKSKWLSSAMSAVLPGSGQVYTGKIMHGLISFASVAAAGYMSYAFRDDRPLSITFAFFSGLFYAGNIYGAYNSAESYNQLRDNKFTEEMNNKYNLRYNPEKYFDMRGFLE